LEGWKVGRLEGWKVGRLEGWKVGRLEGWKVEILERLVVWKAAILKVRKKLQVNFNKMMMI